MAEEGRPTVKPKIPLDVAGEIGALKKAMKGLGTDEAAIIRVLVGCTSSQRQILRHQYDNSYSRDLIKDLKKELSGDFEEVILAMMWTRTEYLMRELHNAVKHKKGQVLVEILCTHDNNFIRDIKNLYEHEFDVSLEDDLKKALSGTFEAVMLGMADAKRSDDFKPEMSQSIAEKLYNGGHGLVEDEVVKELSRCSFKQLDAVFVSYYQLAGRTLGETFDQEYKGDEKTNMKFVFKSLQNRPAFFAELLHSALIGSGTKDDDLVRLVVSRSEVDLGNIKSEYQTMYNTSLETHIKGDTSGNYKKVLLALLDPN